MLAETADITDKFEDVRRCFPAPGRIGRVCCGDTGVVEDAPAWLGVNEDGVVPTDRFVLLADFCVNTCVEMLNSLPVEVRCCSRAKALASEERSRVDDPGSRLSVSVMDTREDLCSLFPSSSIAIPPFNLLKASDTGDN